MRRFPFYVAMLLCLCPGRYACAAMDVFVSIAPQKYLVQRIGGDRVRVEVMLKPGHSPETYDPSPSQVARLASTRIYFLIGVPFESRWHARFQQQNGAMHMVDSVRDCSIIDQNPHVWTSPVNAQYIATVIRDTLMQEDPAGASYYAANFRRLVADLEGLDKDIQARLRHRRTDYFIVSHDAWSYYAARYGLEQLALESGGREKGPRGIAQLVEQARRENIQVVFIQSQHPTGAALTLARELHAGVVEIDPLAPDYISNLRRVTASIAQTLQ